MSESVALLDWYSREALDLPWRRTAEPYPVWVSEVMLQQTRVATVILHFPGFMRIFPTVESLAEAPLEDVLASWAGLGYYRRARSLHAAARVIVSLGGFPTTATGWQALPGIGPYTAAAVASIAFGAVAVAVDTNVERVVSRYLGLPPGRRSPKTRQRLESAAAALLVPGRAGDSNQALMELGERVCTQRAPGCELCPLSKPCRARQAGIPAHYPKARVRRAKERQLQLAVAVGREGRWLLVRRSGESAVLAGTWELPWVAASAAPERDLQEAYGGSWRLGAALGRTHHAITYRQIETELRLAAVKDAGAVGEGLEAGWFTAEEIGSLPRSSLLAKLWQLLPPLANAPTRARG